MNMTAEELIAIGKDHTQYDKMVQDIVAAREGASRPGHFGEGQGRLARFYVPGLVEPLAVAGDDLMAARIGVEGDRYNPGTVLEGRSAFPG